MHRSPNITFFATKKYSCGQKFRYSQNILSRYFDEIFRDEIHKIENLDNLDLEIT